MTVRRPRQPMPDFVRRAAITCSLLVILPACSTPDPSPVGVLLDGLFDEWSTAATIIDDPPDTDAAVDLLSVQGLDDGAWLYLALDLGTEVNLQSLPGTLRILFDGDADSATGGTVAGMDGVDLVVDLSEPSGGERGAGFSILAIDPPGAERPVGRHDLGLTAAPTWAAPRFELRLSRLGSAGSSPLGPRLRLKLVYRESGATVEETAEGEYTFQTDPRPAVRPEVAGRLRRPPASVRVVQWNVAWSNFTQRPADFARVLGALQPDVVLLDELHGEVTADELGWFFQSEPLRRLGTWEHTLGTRGGLQRAAVATRDRGISPAAALQAVTYPGGTLEALTASAPSALHDFLEREVAGGISATGAWVGIDGQSVLFVAADLQSGGWAGSPWDRLRTVQAATIRDRVANELLARPGPVVIGGDLNLVGSRAPLFAMVRGLDVDGSDLLPVPAERLGERTYSTWRNPWDSFAPGRLDFILVSDAAVTVVNSFVFATEDLDDETLTRLDLERDLMADLSDHLVVVADLVFGTSTDAGIAR